jgi:L-rhamnose mutarotase
MTLATTSGKTAGAGKAAGIFGFLGLFAGLCSVLALVVSAAEGWREHTQQSWPEVTARIQRCSVDQYYPYRRSNRRISFWIRCRIAYQSGSEEIATRINSHTAFTDTDVAIMQQWVAEHPPDSSIVVRYDPANHGKAVLMETDMPFAGPRTPNNLQVLLMAAVACVVLLTIARTLTRRAAAQQNAAAPIG